MEYEPWVQQSHRDNMAARRAGRLPVCDGCGDTIDDETHVLLDGKRYCPRCIRQATVYTEEEEVEPWSRSGWQPGRRWS